MAFKINLPNGIVVEAETAAEMEEACRRLNGLPNGGGQFGMQNSNVIPPAIPIHGKKRHRSMAEALREIFQNNQNQPISIGKLAAQMQVDGYIGSRTKNPRSAIRTCTKMNRGFVIDGNRNVRLAVTGETDRYAEKEQIRDNRTGQGIGQRELAIMEVLMDAGGPMNYKDIAGKIGAPVHSTGAVLSTSPDFIGCPLYSGVWGLKGRDEHYQKGYGT